MSQSSRFFGQVWHVPLASFQACLEHGSGAEPDGLDFGSPSMTISSILFWNRFIVFDRLFFLFGEDPTIYDTVILQYSLWWSCSKNMILFQQMHLKHQCQHNQTWCIPELMTRCPSMTCAHKTPFSQQHLSTNFMKVPGRSTCFWRENPSTYSQLLHFFSRTCFVAMTSNGCFKPSACSGSGSSSHMSPNQDLTCCSSCDHPSLVSRFTWPLRVWMHLSTGRSPSPSLLLLSICRYISNNTMAIAEHGGVSK